METTAEEINQQEGRHYFSYNGNGTDFAILMLKNFFLTLITIGLYSPWARTNTRRYIWENTKFMGDRGTYVGKGDELFLGWVKIFGVLVILGLLSRLFKAYLPFLSFPMIFITPLVYVGLFALATYAGLRYRMSRTLWRQIRFGVDKNTDSTKEFTKLYFKGVFLTVFSLGLYYPIFQNRIRAYLMNKSRMGNEYFKYTGSDREYFKVFHGGALLSFLTLGIYTPWFFSKILKFRLKHTSFQSANFKFTMSGKDILVYGFVSYLGTILTLGFASPWIFSWALHKVMENVCLEGSLDFSSIQQQKSDGNAIADDLADEYDLDLGFLF